MKTRSVSAPAAPVITPAAEAPLAPRAKEVEAPATPAVPSTFDPKPAEAAKPLEYHHDPLYDALTADKQLDPKQVAQGYVTEWNGLNKVKVAETRRPTSVDDVRQALADATKKGLRVSTSGARHSSGSQSLTPNSLHLDMTQLRGVSYDAAAKTVKVKAGTNWLDVMESLQDVGRSVAVKQEFANFTVGGSVSVNAMGRDWRFGPLGNTVKSLDVMLADGKVVHATRDNEHAELFKNVIGGLGMFGVVLEAELETVPNARYDQSFETVKTTDFDAWTKRNVLGDPDAHIYSGALSTSPKSFMGEVEVNTWRARDGGAVPDFKPEDANKVRTWFKHQLLNASRLGGPLGKEAFWWAYKNLLPHATPKEGVRNDALAPPYEVLKPTANDHAQALDVSIVPRDQLPKFLEQVKQLQEQMGTNVFVATVYPVKTDETAALRAVKKDSYVVTLGLDFKRTDEEQEKAKAFYRGVAEASLDSGGSMYLTHQLPFTKEQLLRAYPELPQVLETKKRYDPNGLFDNVLVDKYGS